MNTARNRRISGQGMTEYIIIVALIAIAAIAAYSFFGQSLRGQVAGMASEVSGGTAAAGRGAATAAAGNAQGQATATKQLGNYGATEN